MNEQTNKPMEFIPFGNQDKIKLTVAIVKNLLCKPTRSGKLCSDKDALKFMMLASARKLNPFEGDAFLVGFDNRDGIAEFCLITAEQALLKRAELNADYEGLESGVIILNEEGTVIDIAGEFTLDTQQCVGGWARLTVKNRKIPFYERLALRQYIKPGLFWEKNPQHQICKCARAAVLRRAFPTSLSGLYLQEETNMPMKRADAYEIQSDKLVDVVQADAQAPAAAAILARAVVAAEVAPASAKAQLQSFVESNGHTFQQFRDWAKEMGAIRDADSLASWEDVLEKDAQRLLRAKKGFVQGLAAAPKASEALVPEGKLL